MNYLLTSAGIKNKSIHQALLSLLSKPIEECNALCITTAIYGFENGPKMAYDFIQGKSETPMCELGWKSLAVLELSALSEIDPNIWQKQMRSADVLLVNGGDPLFLFYWMNKLNFQSFLPTLNATYVGLSAGSMVITPRIGQDFVNWNPHQMSDETLGLVPFSLFPHLDHPSLPDNIMSTALKWAQDIKIPAYALDDESAILVRDKYIEVISEGQWHPLNTSSSNV